MFDSKLGPAPEALVNMMQRMGSNDPNVSIPASYEFASAVQVPLRQGVLTGDIVGEFGIFEMFKFSPSMKVEYPLDFLAPGTERDFVAYVCPHHGRIPERNVEGDYVTIPTYEIANSIDYLKRYLRDARWDVASRALDVLRAGHIKKKNDDAWHLLMAAGVDRNILVYDSDAEAGTFTKRLVSLMKTLMRRNGGGNSTSTNRGVLTDIYMSPENMEDIRNWGVDQIDEVTRKQIFDNDGFTTRIFGVNLHDLDELGDDQEYQFFYEQQLSGTFATDDVELLIGLDQSKNDCFVMPVVNEIEVLPATDLERARRTGSYSYEEFGLGVLDSRRVILGSC